MSPDAELTLPRQRAGIYHLIRDGRVVYVGQSVNLLARIGIHDYTQYDAVRFFYCDPAELDEREQADIERLQPALNHEGVTKKYRSPTMPKAVYQVERARLSAWMAEWHQRGAA